MGDDPAMHSPDPLSHRTAACAAASPRAKGAAHAGAAQTCGPTLCHGDTPATGVLTGRSGRWCTGLAAVALAGLLAGCAHQAPNQRVQPGQTEAQVLGSLGAPTNRYPLPDAAGQRLEYARGPLGFETWMVDLDPAGRVRQVEQVLGPRRFAEVRRGMSEADLLRQLGRPATRQREYMDRETLFWRYNRYDCIWFAVTLSPQRRVLDAANGLPDPRCDASQ